MSQSESQALPVAPSAKDRHIALMNNDLHPTIDMDDTYWGVLQGLDHGGVVIKDGDRLIGFMERNECPVCHQKDSVRVKITTKSGEMIEPSYTFIRGAKTRISEDGEYIYNDAIKKLESKFVTPIVCRDHLIGVATEDAVRDYYEWNSTRNSREQFRDDARNLSNTVYLDDLKGQGYSKGMILAAIYELLDCDRYDPRDLMGRENLTKSQLYTIMVRLQSLNVSFNTGYHEDDWIATREFGVANGDVEWHVPEWVDFDDPQYERLETELFGE